MLATRCPCRSVGAVKMVVVIRSGKPQRAVSAAAALAYHAMLRFAAAQNACQNFQVQMAAPESVLDEPPQTPQTLPATGVQQGRLDSWKKIASYLKRDVSTVQRWERREAMPVHRHLHDKLGSIYAFRSELDDWWASRRAQLTPEIDTAGEASAPGIPAQPAGADAVATAAIAPYRRDWIWPTVMAGLLLALISGYWLIEHAGYLWRNPLANATFRTLTDFEGTEKAAAISGDGSTVAFLADRDGPMDVWVTKPGTDRFQNLTLGAVHQLVNPSIRTLGFSPDGQLVSIWSREPDGSRPQDISLQAAPVAGGALRPFLAQAAEFDWSRRGQLVYHTTAPGDPLFIRSRSDSPIRQLYVAPAGVHCHFPIWSPDEKFIYFVRGVPPDDWDIWRVKADGGTPERISFFDTRVTHPVFLDDHTLLYLATERDGAGPWLYAMNIDRRDPHRVSTGIERYSSLAANADATRLVLSVSSVKSTLWRVDIARPSLSPHATRIALPGSHASAPQVAPGVLVYVSAEGGRSGIWKLTDGTASELWSDRNSRITSAPAIAPDGRSIAFVAETGGHARLHLLHNDGATPQLLGASVEVRGAPAWAPDGQSLVCAVNQGGMPRLFRFFINGAPPALLVSEYSIDPVWSPDGEFLVYSGPDVGTTFQLRAASADGRTHSLPSLMMTRGARRVRFLRAPDALVFLRGEIDNKNFWQVDLKTGAEQQLTHFVRDYDIRDFDISTDGSEIVFDRMQENSDLVLVERTHQ